MHRDLDALLAPYSVSVMGAAARLPERVAAVRLGRQRPPAAAQPVGRPGPILARRRFAASPG